MQCRDKGAFSFKLIYYKKIIIFFNKEFTNVIK
jgi:hypothetical protein